MFNNKVLKYLVFTPLLITSYFNNKAELHFDI